MVAKLEGIDLQDLATLSAKEQGDHAELHVRHDLGAGPGAGEVVVDIAKLQPAGGLLEAVPADKQLRVDFKHLSAWVPNLFGNPEEKKTLLGKVGLRRRPRAKGEGLKPKKSKEEIKKDAMKQVLFDVTGCCRPGEVLAMMGPSGSGKTTLLSALGGRVPKAVTMEGQPLFNGQTLSKRAKRQIGFVLQDDLLYEALTVYETLYYAAMLRLPQGLGAARKVARVEAVIAALGLDKCRHTIIGGFFRRGVSGGERKRVSVGHELLINPSLVLLDEPTSGLDSTTAMSLVTTLCQLAAGGRAVITTIHQPSSRLYQQLDKLMLLSEGHLMYYGQAGLAAQWFHTLGFTLPYGTNVADFILDLASGAVDSPKLDGERSRRHLVACAERFARQREAEDGYREGAPLGEADLGDLWTAALSRRSLLGQTPGQAPHLGPPGAKLGAEEGGMGMGPLNRGGEVSSASSSSGLGDGFGGPGGRRWGASWPLQIRILFVRALKTRRFNSVSTQDIIQFVVVGVLCGLFWWQQAHKNTLVSATNTAGLLFFEMLFLSFRSMFIAVFTFPDEQKMMLKERASGMYRLSAFYVARSASDLPLELSAPSIFVFIIYFMGGLRLTAGAFFANWWGTMLCTLVAQSFGLLIGATVMEAKTAQTVTAVVMLSFMLVGGFYVNNIPTWIAWLKYVSFVYYGYDLLLKVEFVGRTLYDCAGQNPDGPEQRGDLCRPVPPADLSSRLHWQESVEQWPWEILALFGFLIVFRVLVYVALRYKTK